MKSLLALLGASVLVGCSDEPALDDAIIEGELAGIVAASSESDVPPVADSGYTLHDNGEYVPDTGDYASPGYGIPVPSPYPTTPVTNPYEGSTPNDEDFGFDYDAYMDRLDEIVGDPRQSISGRFPGRGGGGNPSAFYECLPGRRNPTSQNCN